MRPQADASARPVPTGGRKAGGELLVVCIGAAPVQQPSPQLVTNSRTAHGRPSGDAMGVGDTPALAARHGVRAWVEEAPPAEAAAAHDRMMRDEARFRMMPTTGV
ncbi:hypothetical protein [Streptomyces sp. NPDC054804]